MTSHQNTSMLPLIYPDDQLIIKKNKLLKINSIIAFKQNQHLTAHRILHIDKKGKYAITRGDNNSKIDKKVLLNQILGKVETIKRDGEIIHLKHLYLTQTAQYLKSLKDIHSKFAQNKIKYTTLKGYPTTLHYAKIPLKRLFLDLDILIKKSQSKKAEKVIKSLGFTLQNKSLNSFTSKNPTQIVFKKEQSPFPIYIDLHTEPSLGFTLGTHLNSIYPDSDKISKYLLKNSQYSSEGFNILAPKAQLISLFMHFFHHNFQGLEKLEIIGRIAPLISWKELISDIKDLSLEPYIFPSMKIFNHFYPNSIPSNVLGSINNLKTQIIFQYFIYIQNPFNQSSRIRSGITRLFLGILTNKTPVISLSKIITNPTTYELTYSSIKSFFSS